MDFLTDPRILFFAFIALACLGVLFWLGRLPREGKRPKWNTEIQLDNCPFCGKGHIILVHDEAHDLYRARCPTCHALGPFGMDYWKAAERWNERTLRIDV